MAPFLKFMKQKPWAVVCLVLAVAAGVSAWVDQLNGVRSAWNFWSALDFSEEKVKLTIQGTALLIGLGLAPIFAGYFAVSWLIHFIASRSLSRCVRKARDSAIDAIRDHLTTTIKRARPPRTCNRNDQRIWTELLAAAVKGHADPGVLQHLETAHRLSPLIFCNFCGYANSVKAVLDVLQRDVHHHVQIYTLLKRSIINWYNPFPVGDPASQLRGHITVDWWESYKAHIASLKEEKNTLILLKRLVAHPPPAGQESDVQNYYLLSDAALTAEVARSEFERLGGTVSWHPSVKAMQSLQWPRPARLHLIGKPANKKPMFNDDKKLVFRFNSTFHNAGRTERDSGVFVKFATDGDCVQALLGYDDVFIVRLSDRLTFALVYVDDERLDINGMWVGPHRDGDSEDDEATTRELIGNFERAWSAAQDDFAYCRGAR